MKTILFTLSMIFGMNVAIAENNFSTLADIPAVAMNNEDLKSVEGKSFEYNWYYGLLHVNDYTGVITHWKTGTYLGRRQLAPKTITLQDIQNAFPDSYRPNRSSSQTGKFLNNQLFGNQFSNDLTSAHSSTFSHSTGVGTRP